MPKSKPGTPQRTRDNQRAHARRTKRWLVIRRQDGRCDICHQKRHLTVDHVVPLVLGGSNTLDNLRGICNPCRVKLDQSHGDGKAWREQIGGQ